jgi:hypothetical protein
MNKPLEPAMKRWRDEEMKGLYGKLWTGVPARRGQLLLDQRVFA